MKEIDFLIEKAYRNLRYAESFLRDKDYESSVSRSYYAMFYATEALLLTKDLKFSSHRSVISLFGQHFVKTGIFDPKFGKNMSKAYEKRLIGDYSFAPKIRRDDAEETYPEALEFVETIRNYLQGRGYLRSSGQVENLMATRRSSGR